MESLDAYLARLASDDAVPGGGSAAAVVASLAAALVAMVGRIARRNPKNAAAAPAMEAIVARADALRSRLADARRSDESAFEAVVAAQALPKRTDDERTQRRERLDEALERAAQEPLSAIALSLEVLELALALLEVPSGALSSDVGCAAEFAYAAIAACAYNVRINHRYMHYAAALARQDEQLRAGEARGRALLESVRAKTAHAGA